MNSRAHEMSGMCFAVGAVPHLFWETTLAPPSGRND